MKQLMLMRTRGVLGPAFARIGRKLIRSVGNSFSTLRRLYFTGTSQGNLATTISIPAGNTFHLTDVFELTEVPTTNYTVRGSGVNSQNTVRIKTTREVYVNIGGRAATSPAIAVGSKVTIDTINDGSFIRNYLDGVLFGTNPAPIEEVVHTTIGGNGVGTFNNWRGYIYSSSDEDTTSGTKVSWSLDSGNVDREASNEAPSDASKDIIYQSVSEGDWRSL